jgi:hypothetical protein
LPPVGERFKKGDAGRGDTITELAYRKTVTVITGKTHRYGRITIPRRLGGRAPLRVLQPRPERDPGGPVQLCQGRGCRPLRCRYSGAWPAGVSTADEGEIAHAAAEAAWVRELPPRTISPRRIVPLLMASRLLHAPRDNTMRPYKFLQPAMSRS